MPERVVWSGPDGTVLDLTDEAAGFSVLANGTKGLRNVGYDFAAETYVGLDGDSVQNVRAEASRPSLGLMLRANSEAEFVTRSRALVRSMRPRLNNRPAPGTLTYYRSDGSARSLTCYVTDGLQGDESVDTILSGSWWRMLLALYAPDPWWYGPERRIEFGVTGGGSFFPIFPPGGFAPPATKLDGTFTVDLSDVDAGVYPQWTVTGPGVNLMLINDTTGLSINMTADIPAGSTVVIDTRPGYQSVRRGDGTNLMGSVSTNPALWSLVEGTNNIRAILDGASSASKIVGVYRPKYSGI